jgi:cytochrome c-type biogenesis protein CcmH/NrfG
VSSGATQRAVELYDAGAHRPALEAAGEALAADPDDGLALVVVAGARRALGDLAGSLAAAEQAARLMPTDPRPFTQLAYSRLGARAHAGALAAANEAVRLRPDAAGPRIVVADILVHTPHAARSALEAAEDALRIAPESVDALSIAGEAHLDLSQYRAAHVAFAQALALRPEDYRARHGMGRLANVDFGRPTESIVRFARMLAERPGDDSILVNLRAALLRLINRLFWVLLLTPLGAGLVFAVTRGATDPAGGSRSPFDFPTIGPFPTIAPFPTITLPPMTPLPTVTVPASQLSLLAAEHPAGLDLARYAITAAGYGLAVWIVVAVLVLVTLRRIRPHTRSIVLLGWRDGPLRAFALTTAAIAVPLPAPFGFSAAFGLAIVAILTRRVVIAVIMQRNRARN